MATTANVMILISLMLNSCAMGIGTFDYYPYSPKNAGDRYLSSSFIQAMADAVNKDYSDKYGVNQDNQQFDADDSSRRRLATNVVDIPLDDYVTEMTDDDNIVPSLRDIEYLQRNPLWGHQLIAGGAGEGKQRLKPAGTVNNKNEVKTDSILPAYCNPPNPCPVSYTSEDGCIENFENTASFSRKYQAAQKCMCDTEHMFNCPSNHDSPFDNDVKRARVNIKKVNNPYLEGEKLPVAAKKGINVVE